MVTRAYQTNIAKIHVARHPFDGQFTLPVLHKPKFVMEMGPIGFVERSNFVFEYETITPSGRMLSRMSFDFAGGFAFVKRQGDGRVTFHYTPRTGGAP